MKTSYTVIGIMSGSSMDGVDLACCRFSSTAGKWQYEILCADTIPYTEMWRVRLSELYKQPIEIFPKTDMFYGRYLGQLVLTFMQKHSVRPDFVASHGHTIFHRPEAGFTAQIGNGAALSATCKLPVVSDFRSMDLALGGQGAPLVPIGDILLFPEYDACLNLGGISNISYRRANGVRAYDISPCNIVFNRVARWLGLSFDAGGAIAASASVDEDLLEELDALPYYAQEGAKSLGREWINEHFWPLVKAYPDTSEAEKMATLAEHISGKLAQAINNSGASRVLVTGGGALNHHLLQLTRRKCGAELVVPEPACLHYKEALIFGLLGVLRVSNQVNVLSSVTGSGMDHVAGALHGDFSSLQ